MIDEIRKEVSERPEEILCSAIYVDDGIKRARTYAYPETGILFCGCRHIDCMVGLSEWAERRTSEERMKIYDIYANQIRGNRQGFVTTRGRFVDRVEAAEIARSTGQWDQLTHQLFSEDVW